jgi:hypothetical protein
MKIRLGGYTFLAPQSHLALNGRNVKFVNSVKHLGVIFEKKFTWRLHIEMIEAKAFRIFARIRRMFPVQNDRLSVRNIMPYVCPAWEFGADNHLLKLQRLQNKVFSTTGNLPRHTLVRDLHMAFKLSYIYDYATKLCRQPAEVIQNHEN